MPNVIKKAIEILDRVYRALLINEETYHGQVLSDDIERRMYYKHYRKDENMF